MPEPARKPTHNMIQLGCIADDFTSATDLSDNLVRCEMRVLQTIGVPDAPPNINTPGFPVDQHSAYQGHLFVGHALPA